MLDSLRNKIYESQLKRFVNFLEFLKIKPNQITTLGLISGILAAYFIYKYKLIYSIIFIVISTICDLCDGWIARNTKQESKFGRIYDVTMDKYVEGLIGLSLAFVVMDFYLPGYFWVLIGLFGSILISVVSNSAAQVTDKKSFKFMSRPDRGMLLVIGLLAAVFLGKIYLTYMVILMAVFSHLTVILLLISYRKILRKEN